MKIRPTQIRDIAHLPDIEQSAGLRFRDAPGLTPQEIEFGSDW